MIQANATPNRADGRSEALRERSTIDRIIENVTSMELPARRL